MKTRERLAKYLFFLVFMEGHGKTLFTHFGIDFHDNIPLIVIFECLVCNLLISFNCLAALSLDKQLTVK